MEHVSLWKAISKPPAAYQALNHALEVDVAIIGGGITGITTALQLINAGKKVAILEAGTIGGVTTGFSSGNLYVAVQPYYQQIIKKFDLETAKAIAQSRQGMIDFIEQIVKQYRINCHFARRPWYIYTDDDSKLSFLENEIDAFQKMDVPIVETQKLSLPFKFKKAAVIENQARFNCLQYVMDLAYQLSQRGCHIFENTRVKHIEEKDVCTVHTQHGQVTAKKVVIATHTPIGINAVQTFTAPYRSYAVAVQLKQDHYPEGHFWDLNQPHHATCTHAILGEKPDILIIAGNHHKVGQAVDAEAHYKQLISFARDHFEVAEIAYQWSAQHYHAADDVPYIGLSDRFAKHTYMATGFFADGLIYGTLAGIILSHLILNKKDPLTATYKTNRFKPFASLPFLMKESSNILLQYLKDYPFVEKDDYQDIKRGDGKVVEINREKWAVSRDEHDQLHVVSAVCTHMKCIVNWNNAEKTWDCPCHGSRFTCAGKVIEGPAMEDLKTKE